MNPRLSTVIVCVMILVAGLSYITSSAQEIQQDNTAADSGQFIIVGTTIRVPLEVAAAQQGALAASTMSENFEGAWPSAGWQIIDQVINDGSEYLLRKRIYHSDRGSFS